MLTRICAAAAFLGIGFGIEGCDGIVDGNYRGDSLFTCTMKYANADPKFFTPDAPSIVLVYDDGLSDVHPVDTDVSIIDGGATGTFTADVFNTPNDLTGASGVFVALHADDLDDFLAEGKIKKGAPAATSTAKLVYDGESFHLDGVDATQVVLLTIAPFAGGAP